MKLEDIQKVQQLLTPDKSEVADKLRAIALDIKEITIDFKSLNAGDFTVDAFKVIAVNFYELADRLEGVVSCDICGDCHDIDSVPLSCQTGDGC